jgi:hypothetical protein
MFEQIFGDFCKGFEGFGNFDEVCDELFATSSKKAVNKQAIFELIKVNSREAAVESFTAYNKTRFKQQMTGSQFLTAYSQSTPKLDCNQEGLKYIRYEYIFGIPFMLFEPKTGIRSTKDLIPMV